MEPDEEDDSVTSTRTVMGLVGGEATGPEDQRHEHTTGSEKPDRTTSPTINLQSECDGNNGREGSLASGEAEAIKRNGDTGIVVELPRVVGDNGVARPLGEETERDEYSKTIAVAGGADEVQVARGLLGSLLEANGLADLLVLELDGGMLLVAVGVVLGEDGEGFLGTVLGDEETGRLGDP